MHFLHTELHTFGNGVYSIIISDSVSYVITVMSGMISHGNTHCFVMNALGAWTQRVINLKYLNIFNIFKGSILLLDKCFKSFYACSFSVRIWISTRFHQLYADISPHPPQNNSFTYEKFSSHWIEMSPIDLYPFSVQKVKENLLLNFSPRTVSPENWQP